MRVLSKKTSIEKQRPGGSTRSITGSLSFYPPARTLDRWVKDESIGFPKPIVVRRRSLAAFLARSRPIGLHRVSLKGGGTPDAKKAAREVSGARYARPHLE